MRRCEGLHKEEWWQKSRNNREEGGGGETNARGPFGREESDEEEVTLVGKGGGKRKTKGVHLKGRGSEERGPTAEAAYFAGRGTAPGKKDHESGEVRHAGNEKIGRSVILTVQDGDTTLCGRTPCQHSWKKKKREGD